MRIPSGSRTSMLLLRASPIGVHSHCLLKKSRQMRHKPRKKKKTEIKLVECSECHKFFDVDELKILWREFRLVCKDCFERLAGIF